MRGETFESAESFDRELDQTKNFKTMTMTTEEIINVEKSEGFGAALIEIKRE